jgi:hypothetical protein
MNNNVKTERLLRRYGINEKTNIFQAPRNDDKRYDDKKPTSIKV